MTLAVLIRIDCEGTQVKQESIKEHTEIVQVLRWHEGMAITALAMQAIKLLH